MSPGARISSQRELQQTALIREINFDEVLGKTQTPPFRPPKDHLNCDPSLELEEMIVEAKPLHKKKKRLAKQRSIQRETDMESSLIKEFIVYNRYKEVHRREMERKELDWEQELAIAMANSEVTNVAPNLGTVEEDNAEANGQQQMTRNNCEDCDTSCNTSAPGSTMMLAANTVRVRRSEKRDGECPGEGGGGSVAVIDFIDRTPSPKPSA